MWAAWWVGVSSAPTQGGKRSLPQGLNQTDGDDPSSLISKIVLMYYTLQYETSRPRAQTF